MPYNVGIDREEFARLWSEGVPNYRIAEHFGIHSNTVMRLACEMKLPQRKRQVDVPLLFRLWGDMTLTRAEIAQRAAECRARHMELRRKEDVTTTNSKVSKWRAGICNPR